MDTVAAHAPQTPSIPPQSDSFNLLSQCPQESPNDRKRRLARERQRRHRLRIRERSRAELEAPTSKCEQTQSIPQKLTSFDQPDRQCPPSQPSNLPLSTPSLPSSHSVPSSSPNFIGLLSPDDTNVPSAIGHLIPPMDVLDDRFSCQLTRSNFSAQNPVVSPNAPTTAYKTADSDCLTRPQNFSSHDQQYLQNSVAIQPVPAPLAADLKLHTKHIANDRTPHISTVDTTNSAQTGSLQTLGILHPAVTPAISEPPLSVIHSTAAQCNSTISPLNSQHSPNIHHDYTPKHQDGLLESQGASQDVSQQSQQLQAAHSHPDRHLQSRRKREYHGLHHHEREEQHSLRLQQTETMQFSEFQQDHPLRHLQGGGHSGLHQACKQSEAHQYLQPHQSSQYHHHLQTPEHSQRPSPLGLSQCRPSVQQTQAQALPHSQAQQFLQYSQHSQFPQYPQRSEIPQHSQDIQDLHEQQRQHSHQYMQQIRLSRHLRQVRHSQHPQNSRPQHSQQVQQYSQYPLVSRHLQQPSLPTQSHCPQITQEAHERLHLQSLQAKQCLNYSHHPQNSEVPQDPSHPEHQQDLQSLQNPQPLQDSQHSHSSQPLESTQNLQTVQPLRETQQASKLLPNPQSYQCQKPLTDQLSSRNEQARQLIHRPPHEQSQELRGPPNMQHRQSQLPARYSQQPPLMKAANLTDVTSSKECHVDEDSEDNQLSGLANISRAADNGKTKESGQETLEGRKQRLEREKQRRSRKRLRTDSEGHGSSVEDCMENGIEGIFEYYGPKKCQRSSAQSQSHDGQNAVLSVQMTSKSGRKSRDASLEVTAPTIVNHPEGNVGVAQHHLTATAATNVSGIESRCAEAKTTNETSDGRGRQQIGAEIQVEVTMENEENKTEGKFSRENIAQSNSVGDRDGSQNLHEDKLSRKRRLARDRQRRRRSRLKERKNGLEPENGKSMGGSECGSSRGATLTAMSGETRTNGEGTENHQRLKEIRQSVVGDLSNDKHKQNNLDNNLPRAISSRAAFAENGCQTVGWMHWSRIFDSEEEAKNTVENALKTLHPQFEDLGPDGRTYVLQQMFIMYGHSSATNDRSR